MHPLLKIYASKNGRLRRRTYWGAAFLLTLTFAALYALLERVTGSASTLVLYPPFLWAAFSLMSKRLHDSARSAWRIAVVIVPVLGPALLLFWLCFSRGTKGENQYGVDPRTVDADYLTVRIGS